MTFNYIIILLACGAGVGFLGGLLGVGGAFMMTPVQYLVYIHMGIPTDTAIKLAFGTNLMVVLSTTLSGTWRHHRLKAVRWRAALTMGSCSLLGALAGATIAVHLPGAALKSAFGIVVLAGAASMLIARTPRIEKTPENNPWIWAAWALPVGIITGLIGIGGGIMVIPVMTLALRFRMHNAIATSLAMMILTSIGGVIGYITNGIGTADLPPYSIGYVNLQSWLLLAVPSIGMVQLGAITAHRIPARQLKYLFIALMLYVGFKMIGLFDWLGWPL
ncbi:MAG: sulfite exporter TauE/SafE family protein [Dehalococcoidales bacterium]|nr:sulfite exporter TauE/SafE family protein [Dehalococcoidales bacterium]